MVGVEMGNDQAVDRAAGERAGEHFLPYCAGAIVGYAAVDDGPAGAVVDDVDVHVVQRERQGKAQPQDTRCQFGQRAGFGCGVGVVGAGVEDGGHAQAPG